MPINLTYERALDLTKRALGIVYTLESEAERDQADAIEKGDTRTANQMRRLADGLNNCRREINRIFGELLE